MTATRCVRRRGGHWVMVNLCRLTLYLAFASFVSAFAVGGWTGDPLFRSDTLEEILGFAAVSFVVGGIGCLPGLVVWLFMLSAARDARRPRAIAIAAAPVIGLVWLVLFAINGSYLVALLYGLFWPLGAGLVVTLPSPPSGGSR